MPQWFVSFEPSTKARTFMGSVKSKLIDLLAHRWQLATVTAGHKFKCNYSAPPMGMSNRLTVVLQQELH